ncbi:hypothetical protein [Streptomyces sp. NPDC056061]|uniref:hypothetical protein n=1 Tax=Streptomyces sp. NPDC056061 TaxID=3345700 RepID=UPI0035DC254E
MSTIPSSRIVLDAAHHCFCHNGYRRTTASGIVDEARRPPCATPKPCAAQCAPARK